MASAPQDPEIVRVCQISSPNKTDLYSLSGQTFHCDKTCVASRRKCDGRIDNSFQVSFEGT